MSQKGSTNFHSFLSWEKLDPNLYGIELKRWIRIRIEITTDLKHWTGILEPDAVLVGELGLLLLTAGHPVDGLAPVVELQIARHCQNEENFKLQKASFLIWIRPDPNLFGLKNPDPPYFPTKLKNMF